MGLNSMSDYSYGKEIRIYGLKDRLISFLKKRHRTGLIFTEAYSRKNSISDS